MALLFATTPVYAQDTGSIDDLIQLIKKADNTNAAEHAPCRSGNPGTGACSDVNTFLNNHNDLRNLKELLQKKGGFHITDKDGNGIDDTVEQSLKGLKTKTPANAHDPASTSSGNTTQDDNNCDEAETLEDQIICLKTGSLPAKSSKDDDSKDDDSSCSGSLDNDINCLETDPSTDPNESGEGQSVPNTPTYEDVNLTNPIQDLTGGSFTPPPNNYHGPPLELPGDIDKELCVCMARLGINECVHYRDANGYRPDGIARLNYLFRDDRENLVCEMDPRLYDLLWGMHYVANQQGAPDKCIKILSGFRTPATNVKVGGAKASKHMRCKAADWKFQQQGWTDCGKLYAKDIMAEYLGLGCYPNTNGHVHPPDPGKQFWPRGAWCDCLDGQGYCGGNPPAGCYN